MTDGATGYLLVRVQLKYGVAERFNEIMSHLGPILEKNGWRRWQGYHRPRPMPTPA